jgi:hypothetical protein
MVICGTMSLGLPVLAGIAGELSGTLTWLLPNPDQTLRSVTGGLIIAGIVATWMYYELLGRVAAAIESRSSCRGLRVISWLSPLVMMLLVWNEVPRAPGAMLAGVMPPPGVGWASTVLLIAARILSSGDFEADLFLWLPVPFAVLGVCLCC